MHDRAENRVKNLHTMVPHPLFMLFIKYIIVSANLRSIFVAGDRVSISAVLSVINACMLVRSSLSLPSPLSPLPSPSLLFSSSSFLSFVCSFVGVCVPRSCLTCATSLCASCVCDSQSIVSVFCVALRSLPLLPPPTCAVPHLRSSDTKTVVKSSRSID